MFDEDQQQLVYIEGYYGSGGGELTDIGNGFMALPLADLASGAFANAGYSTVTTLPTSAFRLYSDETCQQGATTNFCQEISPVSPEFCMIYPGAGGRAGGSLYRDGPHLSSFLLLPRRERRRHRLRLHGSA